LRDLSLVAAALRGSRPDRQESLKRQKRWFIAGWRPVLAQKYVLHFLFTPLFRPGACPFNLPEHFPAFAPLPGCDIIGTESVEARSRHGRTN